MSQWALARLLDVDKGYISNIESPAIATIKRLADALGVSADELLK